MSLEPREYFLGNKPNLWVIEKAKKQIDVCVKKYKSVKFVDACILFNQTDYFMIMLKYEKPVPTLENKYGTMLITSGIPFIDASFVMNPNRDPVEVKNHILLDNDGNPDEMNSHYVKLSIYYVNRKIFCGEFLEKAMKSIEEHRREDPDKDILLDEMILFVNEQGYSLIFYYEDGNIVKCGVGESPALL